MDPELNIAITDLGLVYKVDVDGTGCVKIVMTLTTIGCPLFTLIEDEVKGVLKKIGVSEDKVHLDLTFDPPWSIESMSERGKALLGIG